MYLAHFTDAALYSHWSVTVTMNEETAIGSMYASETVYLHAYSEQEARRKAETLFKKSVLADKRTTVTVQEIVHESSQYGDPEYTIRDGVSLRVPQTVVNEILKTSVDKIEYLNKLRDELLTQRDELAQANADLREQVAELLK